MRKFLSLLGIFLLAFSSFPLAQGSEQDALIRKQTEIQRIERDFQEYQEGKKEEQGKASLSHEESRIHRLENQIATELLDFDEQKRISEDAEEQIGALRQQIGTLTGQLIALDISMNATKKEINLIAEHIVRRKQDLKKLLEERDHIDSEWDIQKNAVLRMFSLLQQREKEADATQFFLKTILSGNSFSHDVQDERQIVALETSARLLLADLEGGRQKIDSVSEVIQREQDALSTLQLAKREEENRLEQQMQSKEFLRLHSQQTEDGFQELLDQSRREMEESAQLIADLQENKDLLEEKTLLLEREWNQTSQVHASASEGEKDEESYYQSGDQFLVDQEKYTLSWPIIPRKGLSAYYLDPSYEGVFGVKHYAIDIPTPQGTEIKAPALGYVYKVSDNGNGYSSLIIAHRDNLMTVYGHVSEFLVKEGDLVHEGDVIALSGGMPGTKGAGYMTTGAHLHLEVFQNGEHVDPLLFLPPLELFQKKSTDVSLSSDL